MERVLELAIAVLGIVTVFPMGVLAIMWVLTREERRTIEAHNQRVEYMRLFGPQQIEIIPPSRQLRG